MNDTTNLRLGIAEVAEAVLGQNLLGLQLGNEPDLYAGYVLHAPSILCSPNYIGYEISDMGIDLRLTPNLITSVNSESLFRRCKTTPISRSETISSVQVSLRVHGHPKWCGIRDSSHPTPALLLL